MKVLFLRISAVSLPPSQPGRQADRQKPGKWRVLQIEKVFLFFFSLLNWDRKKRVRMLCIWVTAHSRLHAFLISSAWHQHEHIIMPAVQLFSSSVVGLICPLLPFSARNIIIYRPRYYFFISSYSQTECSQKLYYKKVFKTQNACMLPECVETLCVINDGKYKTV